MSGLITTSPQKCCDLLNPVQQAAEGRGGAIPSKPRETEWGWGVVKKFTRTIDAGVLAFWEGFRALSPLLIRTDTAASVSPLSPGIGLGPSPPEPGLTRGE